MILKRRFALLLLFLLTFLALCFSCAKDGQAVAVSAPSQLRRCIALTFDDGPSKTTPDVLSALNAAGVHATFFVVATGYNEKYLPLLTEAVSAGHQIALHSASHEYSDIYRSSDAYWEDIALLKERIAPYVDAESIRYLRFPGGSTNTVSRRYGGNRLYQNKLELYCALLDRDAERAQAFTVDMLDSVANGAFSLYSDSQQQ